MDTWVEKSGMVGRGILAAVYSEDIVVSCTGAYLYKLCFAIFSLWGV